MDKVCIASVVLLVFVSGIVGNPGTDFIVSFIQIYHTKDSTDYLLLTPTTNHGADIRVTSPGYPDLVNKTVIIDPGQNIYMAVNKLMEMDYGSLVDKRAIHVTSSENITVVGINKQHSKKAGSSYDTFLVRPTAQLGLEYFAVCYSIVYSKAGSTFAIVASVDDTMIKITLTKANYVSVVFENSNYTSGDVITKTLQQYDVLQIQSQSDLTGSHAISDKPIVGYSGVNRTWIHSYTCLSTLLDQLPPVSVWGKEYITVPNPNIPQGDIYRIVARWSNTAVFVHGIEPFLLQEQGSWKELYLENATYVKANKPIQVGHLSISKFEGTGQTDYAYGDPSLVILSPLEASMTSFTFSTFPFDSWDIHVIVVIEVNAWEGLMLNNESVRNIYTNIDVVEDTTYSIVTIAMTVSSIAYSLSHADTVPFLAYMYVAKYCEGMANSLGNGESTIYSACESSIGFYGDGIDNDCDGKTDEERCCVNTGQTDDDMDLVYNEDCSAPTGWNLRDWEYSVCCGGDNSTYKCKEVMRNSHFRKTNNVQYLAINMTSIRMKNKLKCFEECGSLGDCWAVNYKLASLISDPNCDLLTSPVTGQSTLDGWSHYKLYNTWSHYIPV